MDGWVNKMRYAYNGILFILKKEGRTVTRYDTVNSEDIVLGQTLCASTYMRYSAITIMDRKLNGCQGLEGTNEETT